MGVPLEPGRSCMEWKSDCRHRCTEGGRWKGFIGNAAADFGLRGYVTAYAADSGDQLWRFYTVPRAPALGQETEALEMAAKTWSGDVWHQFGGGGPVWDSMTFDSELNRLYIGTDGALPWDTDYRNPEQLDNLFTNSIVALDAATGEYLWHYQTVPADEWDYNAASHMVLADMEIGGEIRKILMQAPKNGFFYVIDRVSGESLSAYKVPRAIQFVEDFPKTSSGKVMRRKLHELDG